MGTLKAFVRFDVNGQAVPGGPIWAEKAPQNGKWVEIPTYINCCEATTTTTTTVDPLCRLFSVAAVGRKIINGLDCDGVPYTNIIDINEPWKIFFCAQTAIPIAATAVDNGVCSGCYNFEVGGLLFPQTINYVDCESQVQSIEINAPTIICAQSITGNNPNVAYIGPCTQ